MYGWTSLAALVVGFLLDLLLGDPHGWWHPVIGIGKIIAKTEKILRRHLPDTKSGQMAAGVVLVWVTVGISTILPAVLLAVCYGLHWVAGFCLESWLCYRILATKSLRKESMAVADALENHGLTAGQQAVAMIVGRDTEVLDETGVIKATVETVAENASDGVIAPLFYLALGGPVLGFFYKAVNTMDSMVGYKNEKYLYFGRAAARLDDILNYIPARISGVTIVAAAWFCRQDAKGAYKIFRRDGRNHASPNSAQTEAAMAGALQIQLAGDASYFGKIVKKKTIGDPIRPVRRSDIQTAGKILYAAAVLALVTFSAVHLLLYAQYLN